jgi:hypothetical protein
MVYPAVRWTCFCYRLTSSLIPLELLAIFACLSILRLAILHYRTTLVDHVPFQSPPSYLHPRLCLFVIFFFPRQPWPVNSRFFPSHRPTPHSGAIFRHIDRGLVARCLVLRLPGLLTLPNLTRLS